MYPMEAVHIEVMFCKFICQIRKEVTVNDYIHTTCDMFHHGFGNVR